VTQPAFFYNYVCSFIKRKPRAADQLDATISDFIGNQLFLNISLFHRAF